MIATTDVIVSQVIKNLTPSGRVFMTLVGQRFFDHFDEGIVEGSGNWGTGISWQMHQKTGKSVRSSAGIMTATKKLGLWETNRDEEENSDWWSLTELGAAVANRLADQEVTLDQVADAVEKAQDSKPVQTVTVGRKWTTIRVDGKVIAEISNDHKARIMAFLTYSN